jgi:phage-related minor tail protein
MSGSLSDSEIQVMLTANTADLNSGMESAAAAVQSSVQAQIAAFGELDALLEGHTETLEQLQAQEQALDTLQQAGLVSTQELTEAFAALDTAEASLVSSTEAVAEAQVEANAAMTISGGVARELGVMIGELARGNYTRLEGSTITLANRTGVLSTALSAILSPLGLLAIAAAAVGYSIFEAGQQFEAMEGTVLATGDASGYTAGQLIGMADKIGQSTGSISNATEAVQKLAESGRFAGQNLQLVATAAADMSALTGESVESCVAQIEKLQEDPLKAVAKLNDQFHFLTVSEYEQMQQLAQSGDTMGAAQVAYEAMASAMQTRTDELNTHVNVLVSTFRRLKNAYTEEMQELDVALGGGDDSERLALAVRQLNNLKEQDEEAQKMGRGSLPEITLQLQRQTEVVQQMTAQFHGQAEAAAAVGAAAQKSAQQIDQMAKQREGNGDRSASQEDKQDLEEMQVARTVSLGEEKAYWEMIASSAQQGSEEYRQAIQQLIEIKDKQAEAAKEAARQQTEAEKQANAETMNDLEIQRAQTQEYSAQRIAIDEKIVQTAAQLYGEDSAQYKRAIEEKESDSRELQEYQKRQAQEQVRQQEQALQDQNRLDNEDLDNKIRGYQEDYQQGSISAAKLLSLEEEVAKKRLAIDQEYYRAREALDKQDAATIERDQAQIAQAQQHYTQEMLKDQTQYTKAIDQQWKTMSNEISRDMVNSLNQIVFSGQHTQQSFAQISAQIGENLIRVAIEQPLERWIAAEIQKLAASIATSVGVSTATKTQATTDQITNKETTASGIANSIALAGAQGVASFAGAPWPVDMGAPEFGASMAEAAAGFGTMASAAGGWDNVNADQLAMIHKQEMILPAHIADFVRSGAQAAQSSGGAGGGFGAQNIHIHANDAKSFSQMLQRDPKAIAKAARRAMNPGGRRR